MGVWATNSKGQRYKIAGVGLPGPAATINGMNTLTVTAGDHIKLDQADGELKIGVNLDNGSIAGDTSLLDDLKSPGTYNWLDEEGELGIAGGLWNVAVTNSAYSTGHPSITQALVGTYGPGVTGRVLARSFYYANNPQWTPWRELVSLDQISNPNLLDNWYFADPVNQRGQAEYGRGYTIDRWFFGCDSEESKVMVGAGGIGLRSAENSGYNNLEQRIPKSRFLSGVYTLSFLVSNPGETKQVYIFGVDTVWDPQGTLCSITAYVDCNTLTDIVTIGLQKSISATPLTVIAAKLELGSQQTLAHQDAAGNWVLNDPPPDKTLELLKCQWYQQCAGFTRVAFGPIIAGHTVSSSIQIGKMRENPTCKLGLLDIPYQEHIAFDPAKMIFICTDRHNISIDISDMEIANRVAGKTVTIVIGYLPQRQKRASVKSRCLMM